MNQIKFTSQGEFDRRRLPTTLALVALPPSPFVEHQANVAALAAQLIFDAAVQQREAERCVGYAAAEGRSVRERISQALALGPTLSS